jgi:hypothetical protein
MRIASALAVLASLSMMALPARAQESTPDGGSAPAAQQEKPAPSDNREKAGWAIGGKANQKAGWALGGRSAAAQGGDNTSQATPQQPR